MKAGSAKVQKAGDVSDHFFRAKIWGSRGSLPSPLTPEVLENHIRALFSDFIKSGGKSESDVDEFLAAKPRHQFGGYGGNTPCIEVSTPTQQIIIDAGSGIRPLGYDLMKGACGKGAGESHIFFTHFHWDHLVGLPFFTPIFIPGNKVHVYAVQPDLETVFQVLFKKPYFPISLNQLGATIIYHRLEPRKPYVLGDLTITPYELDHPDPCWGYKIQNRGKAYAHCVDTECTRVTRQQLGPDHPLYEGIDLMVFDAQYTLMETIEKVNWGHAAASLGLDIAMREGIKKVVFMHHDPASTHEKIAAAERQARKYYNSQIRHRNKGFYLHDVDWVFGYEGMVLDI